MKRMIRRHPRLANRLKTKLLHPDERLETIIQRLLDRHGLSHLAAVTFPHKRGVTVMRVDGLDFDTQERQILIVDPIVKTTFWIK